MTKRRAGYLLVGGVTAVLVASPLFVSWIHHRTALGNPRAHYVYGSGRIAGVFGAGEARRKLTNKAERIARDRVVLVIHFADEWEMRTINDWPPHERFLVEYEKISSSYDWQWEDRIAEFGEFSTYTDWQDLSVNYEVHRTVAAEFEAAIEEDKAAYRKAQQDEARESR